MLRLVFAGTPDFAAASLAALHAAGHEIALVLTRPDQPAGRGQAMRESAVKRLARELGLPLAQPRTLRDATLHGQLRALETDAMVVAAYGAILPPEVLAIPALGCVNVHASLLPRWRGAAPIQRAIAAGDAETGVTIMQMDEGLDTGAILLVERTPIGPGDNAATVHDRLAALGARAIVEALDALARGTLVARPQPVEGATYAHKIGRDDARIDWSRSVRSIVDHVRAFDPTPGSVAVLDDEAKPVAIKVWRAAVAPTTVAPTAIASATLPPAAPGTIVSADDTLVVACGDGAVELLELQKSGGRRMRVRDFLRGYPIAAGRRFSG